MATTITSYRVVPVQFLSLSLWAVERFVTVDSVENQKQIVAIALTQAAAQEILTLPTYETMRLED